MTLTVVESGLTEPQLVPRFGRVCVSGGGGGGSRGGVFGQRVRRLSSVGDASADPSGEEVSPLWAASFAVVIDKQSVGDTPKPWSSWCSSRVHREGLVHLCCGPRAIALLPLSVSVTAPFPTLPAAAPHPQLRP